MEGRGNTWKGVETHGRVWKVVEDEGTLWEKGHGRGCIMIPLTKRLSTEGAESLDMSDT